MLGPRSSSPVEQPRTGCKAGGRRKRSCEEGHGVARNEWNRSVVSVGAGHRAGTRLLCELSLCSEGSALKDETFCKLTCVS